MAAHENGKDEKHGAEDTTTSLTAKDRRIRMFRTFACISCWICMGLYTEISGTTLPYLRTRIDINYEQVSRALVARSVGFLAGALLGGVLCQRWYRLTDLWLAISLFIAGLPTAFAPWCPNLPLLGIMFALDGAGKGIMASGTNSLIIRLWVEKSAVPTHALHFSYGIGALLAPQFAKPFLPAYSDVDKCNSITTPATQLANATSVQYSINESLPANSTLSEECSSLEEHIEYPFGIIGALTCLVGLIFLFLQFGAKMKDNSRSQKEQCKERNNGVAPNKTMCERLYYFGLLAILCFLWSFPNGAERAYGKFLYAFSVDELKFSSGEGANLMLVFWVAFTGGRGLATAVSHWVAPKYLLSAELTLSVIASAVLSAFAHSNSTVLWLFTVVFAATLSPIFPACIAWANDYLTMTPMVTALAFIAAAGGAFAFSWISGYLFEYHGPHSLMHFMLFYSIFTTAMFLLFWIVTAFKVRLVGETRKTEDELDEEKKIEMNDLARA